jgi:hypothetical protein
VYPHILHPPPPSTKVPNIKIGKFTILMSILNRGEALVCYCEGKQGLNVPKHEELRRMYKNQRPIAQN